MTVIPTCLEGGHWKTGNLMITPLELEKKYNSHVAMHSHKHGHNMFVLEGEIQVRTFDPSCGCKREVILKAFSHVWIPAGIEHGAYPISEKAKGMCVFVDGEFDFPAQKEVSGWGDLGMFNIEKPDNAPDKIKK